jgi:hypothetical protein
LQKNLPVKTLFNIQSGKEIGSEHTLLLEAGSNYCCSAYLHKQSNTIDALHYASFEETETEQRLSEIIGDANGKTDLAVVCSAFSQALLVPNKFSPRGDELLNLTYNQPAQAFLNDAIPEWQMTNFYSVPERFYKQVRHSFSAVQFVHAYTPTIKIYNGYMADSQVTVHFTTQHFRVLVKKDSTIHLAQTYAYKTPLDVIYYLLKICYELSLALQEVHLVLSGLIEKDSSLFTELQQYFNNVHFAHPPEINLPDHSHPHHFFTSLYNLASCAS